MKKTLTLITSIIITLMAFSTVTYTSCKKDKCKTVTCLNGGTCSEGNCTCQSGYEGSTCATKANEKFAGTYSGTYCDNTVGNFPIYAQSDPLKIAVPVTGLSPNAEGTISGNSFSFPYQQLADISSGETYQFSATGTINGNTISMNYTLITVSSGDINNCSFTGHK